MSAQPLPQTVVPTAQVGTHALCEQTCPRGHDTPHAPQLLPSVVMSVHAPPQVVWPLLHWLELPPPHPPVVDMASAAVSESAATPTART
jgi:hypothetical protein